MPTKVGEYSVRVGNNAVHFWPLVPGTTVEIANAIAAMVAAAVTIGGNPNTLVTPPPFGIFDIVIRMSEDAVALRLAPTGNQPARPWLERFPNLTHLRFSRDGRWAMFVVPLPEEPGGDVYVVGVGSEDAKVVLKAVADKLSYSSPLPKP